VGQLKHSGGSGETPTLRGCICTVKKCRERCMGADGVEVNAPGEVLSPKCLQSHWAYFETRRPSITNQHQT
jgi:hypothetical protein